MGSRHRPSSPPASKRAALFVFALTSLFGASACTDILGIGDRTLNESSTGGATTTTTTSAGGTTGSGGTTSSGGECATDKDCAKSVDGPYCDPATHLCVECVPGGTNTCAGGLYCDGDAACAIGCSVDNDCNPTVAYGLKCDQPIHRCKGCDAEKLCPPGTKCDAGTCVPGCDGTEDCPTIDWQCCTGQCLHTSKDIANCGTCGHVCLNPDQTIWKCVEGDCIGQGCKNGWKDCNDNITEAGGGCEANLANDANNCGACDHVCTANNASSMCTAGQCGVDECVGTYRDCNGNASDGCEADLLNNLKHCGTCDIACEFPNTHASYACKEGVCTLTVCDMGWSDNDGTVSNGCESPSGAGGSGGGAGSMGGGGPVGGSNMGGGPVGGSNMGGSNMGGGPVGGSNMGGAGGSTMTTTTTTTTSTTTTTTTTVTNTGTDPIDPCIAPLGPECGPFIYCMGTDGCCVPAQGSPSCLSSMQCAGVGQLYLCDDRTDCGPGKECCRNVGGGSSCVDTGMCAASTNILLCSFPLAGAISCQCPANQQCCPPTAGGKDSHYGTCQPLGMCK